MSVYRILLYLFLLNFSGWSRTQW